MAELEDMGPSLSMCREPPRGRLGPVQLGRRVPQAARPPTQGNLFEYAVHV